MTTDRRHRRGAAHRWGAGALAVALALAGCGGSHKQASPSPPQPAPGRIVATTSSAPQLVSMRRIDGATYETVLIRTDGTGEVGVFIGEWTGVKHWPFRVDASEMARLRHLVGVADRVGQTPALGSITPSTEYIIFMHPRVLELVKGRVPGRLAGLTDILSGLIDRYS